MELNEQLALNKKLTESFGWKQLPQGRRSFHYELGEKVMDWMPPGDSVWYHSRRTVPNVIDSLDECFEWLMKPLKEKMGEKEYVKLLLRWVLYMESGEEALSLCKEIEKVI